MLLKENEIQINDNGATLKTAKTNIDTWKKNIEEHFESLDYSITKKELNNNQQTQHVYTSTNTKYIFDYYTTGRIVIKTKNVDKLLLNFIEKDEVILGTKLKTIEKHIISPSPTKDFSPSTPRDYKSIRGYEKMYENQEKEICDLKDDMLTLKEENKQLKFLVDNVAENMRENIKLMVSEEIIKQNTVNPNNVVVDKSYKKDINMLSKKSTDTNSRINESERLIKQIRESIDHTKLEVENLKVKIDEHRVINLRHDKSMEQYRNRLLLTEQDLSSTERNTDVNVVLAAPIQSDGDEFKTSRELVIIGSSIVKYINAAKIEKKKPDESETICIPGGKTPHVLEKVQNLKNTHDVKNMILHVGGNHIPHERPDIVITKLQNMLIDVTKIMPNTQLYYSLILPRISNNYLPGINQINNEMTNFCDKNRIKVIFHSNFGGNSKINYQLFNKDIVHPNFKGTSTFARDIIHTYRNYDSRR